MAIVNIQSYTGRLYQFDDVLQKFIMNPNSDAGLLSLTGWDNTPLSISELSALHNGTSLFTGRSDYSGDPQKFPIMVLASGGIVTNSTQLKVRVDRDPDLIYQGSLVFDEATVGTSTNLTIDVYFGQEYATTFQYTANFTTGDYKVYTFSDISYTDPDTGRSATLPPLDITFNQFPNEQPWEQHTGFAHAFEDASQSVAPYWDNSGETITFTPTVGASYVGDPSIPVGNRVLTDYVNQALIGNTNIVPQCRHIVYPRGQKPCQGRTRSALTGSGGKGWLGGSSDWTLMFDCIGIGPQDATEYSNISGEIPNRDHFLIASDATSDILDLNSFINGFNPTVNDFIFKDGADSQVYVNKPATTSLNGKRVYITSKFNDPDTDITVWFKTLEDDSASAITSPAVTNIASPHSRSADNDILFNGNLTDICNVRGITNFCYIEGEALDPTATGNEWMMDYKKLVPSMLALGDSWTGTYPTLGDGPQYDSYSNVIIEERTNAGNTSYDFGIFQNYLQDYIGKDGSYSIPTTATWPFPGWANDWPIPATSDAIHKAFDTLINRIMPSSALLAYTGINYNQLVSPPKATNPVYGNKTYSEPIEACKEHIKILDALGIDYRTVNSAPTAGEQDLIDRAQDATYPWSSFFGAKTYDMFSVVNDIGNNGNILASYQENIAHLNVTGTNALGQDMYTEFVGNIVPTP